MLKGFRDNNEDADALLDSYIKLYNDCLSERPADFHIGVISAVETLLADVTSQKVVTTP